MPSPRENPEFWHRIKIGDIVLPPIAVKGHVKMKAARVWKNDSKQPKGATTARSTSHGRKADSPVTIEVFFQDAPTAEGGSQYDLIQAEMAKLGAGPYAVIHGQAEVADVRDIKIDEIEGPEWDGQGGGKYTIKAKRWNQPVFTGGGKLNLSPEDAKLLAQLQDYLNKLTAQIARDGDSPVGKLAAEEGKLVQAKIKELLAKATTTPTQSKPAKDYYQVGKNPDPQKPLGEIQP